MKNLIRTFAAVTAVALATLSAIGLTACKQEPPTLPTLPTPVISITTQPAAPAALVEGSIPADTRLRNIRSRSS